LERWPGGRRAIQFARELGIRVVDDPNSEEMVVLRAREVWRVWRERCVRWKDNDDGFEYRGHCSSFYHRERQSVSYSGHTSHHIRKS
jgi:hypothetical protein